MAYNDVNSDLMSILFSIFVAGIDVLLVPMLGNGESIIELRLIRNDKWPDRIFKLWKG
ncbi:hypothetical protein ACLOJK_021180 [Asimina triloba]